MTSLTKTERAHQKYRAAEYSEALGLYTEALDVATQLNHRIALHSNRAACHLKLHQYKKAAEECSAVLELDAKHTGALMLRAQTLVAMKDYHSALFDVNRLLESNPQSDVYRSLQARLRTQLALAPISEESEVESPPDSPRPQHQQQQQQHQQQLQQHQQEAQIAPVVEPKAGWEAIPKPKGHTGVDYSRWSNLGDDLSDDEEEEEEEPQYRYRLTKVGLSNFSSV
jgi:tetratricopeptide (TPR) repeat protein